MTRVRKDRPPPRSWCSHCSKPGHTRANRTFHPTLPRLVAGGHGNPRYKKLWRQNIRLRTSMKGICIGCGDQVDRTQKNGDPCPYCRTCQDHWNERAKERRANLKAFEAALREIATGACADPVARAARVLGLVRESEIARAA